MLLLSITTPSPVIQFTALVNSWALPPETALFILLFSMLGQFTQTTLAPVALLLAATAMLKGPLGSFSPCSAVACME